MQPGTAARVPSEQARDARQHNAATKVRSRFRRNQHATLEAKKENPASIGRGNAWSKHRQPTGATMSNCAFIVPATADSSNDFFSVASATLHRARFDSRADFLTMRQTSGGRDGCRQAGACVALTEREGQHRNARDSADACPNTRRSYIR